MRTLTLLFLALSSFGLSSPAVAATLNMAFDQASYAVGDTITLTIVGDSHGALSNGVFGTVNYDSTLVSSTGATQNTLSSFGGAVTWITGLLFVDNPHANTADAFNQTPGLTPFQVDQLLVSVMTFQANAAGVANFSWRTIPGNEQLTFFGLTEAAGGSVTIGAAPSLDAAKADSLEIDLGSDGMADGGDTLRYTVVITNNGTSDATGVVFTDTPDPNTTLVDGSVTTDQGNVTAGNSNGDTGVEVDLGTVPAAGGNVTIGFDVTINDPIPDGVTSVSNQGTVSSAESGDVATDDPDTPAAADATATLVRTTLDLCEADLGTCEGDLGACEGDLGTCEGDLGTCQADLGACQTNPPFEDADADGEHDDTDACPGTPSGEAVDNAGCSIAQFCAGFDIAGPQRKSPCNQADWLNDEPLGAEDCKARGDLCEVR